ncbi:MAG: YjbQ family protein [Candidatus Micrarchaeaceae archaeon]|jgi:secondary thiamine-phosphate synthase enzyme
MAKNDMSKSASGMDVIENIDVNKLTTPSPVKVISEMIGNPTKGTSRKTIVSAMTSANNGNLSANITEMENTNLKELQELMKTAQIISFETSKYRKDLHIRDISRKVDGCIKGGSLDKSGKVKEGSRAKTGLAFVYVEKPDTAVMLMEHEPGSVHDLKTILNANGKAPNTSLFRPFLPVPFISRNIKREGALCQGWGCISLVDGNKESQKTEVKIAVLEADIKTTIIPAKPKPELWMLDITKQINEVLKKSSKSYGHVVICTPHTTVGITINKEESISCFKNTLNAIAPESINYKHNKTAGDNNGKSHLMAEFIGNFIVLNFKNNKLQLDDNRIYAIDCDVQIPREREIITAII